MVAIAVEAKLVLFDAAGLDEVRKLALFKDGLADLVLASNLIAAGHPVHTLGNLLAQGGNMATEAVGGFALGGVAVVVSHHGHLVGLFGQLVAVLVMRAVDVALGICVHRRMADGIAEARLLVPDEKACTCSNQHNGNNAHDDGPLLLAAPSLLGILGGFLGRSDVGLGFLSHGYLLSPIFLLPPYSAYDLEDASRNREIVRFRQPWVKRRRNTGMTLTHILHKEPRIPSPI
ncbi:MAG: hypothetical protein ACLT98_02760 [Eggerthellaceae bacterium]